MGKKNNVRHTCGQNNGYNNEKKNKQISTDNNCLKKPIEDSDFKLNIFLWKNQNQMIKSRKKRCTENTRTHTHTYTYTLKAHKLIIRIEFFIYDENFNVIFFLVK